MTNKIVHNCLDVLAMTATFALLELDDYDFVILKCDVTIFLEFSTFNHITHNDTINAFKCGKSIKYFNQLCLLKNYCYFSFVHKVMNRDRIEEV